jgi:hypothetical protein
MMQNEGPAKRLTDTLVTMNKATRWGQLGQAERMVEPVYRVRFIQTHAHWGQIIQVADSDIVHMEMTPDHETAVAMITYDWYLLSAMTLHTTVVQQRWAQVNETFMLASESVVQGDARLLAPVPGVRPGLPAAEGGAEEISALPPASAASSEP